MVDEYVQGQQQLKAGLAGAQAQVVVLEKALAEAFVEGADLLEHLAADQQAEAGQTLDVLAPAGELPGAAGGEGDQPVEVGGEGDLELLRRRRIAGHRPDQADFGPLVQAPGDQPVQPVRRHHRVVVEQHQVLPAGGGQGLVAAPGKAHVLRVADHLHPRRAGQGGDRAEVLGRAVAGAVVHEDKLVGRSRVSQNAVQAQPRHGDRVAAQDEQRGQLVARRRRLHEPGFRRDAAGGGRQQQAAVAGHAAGAPSMTPKPPTCNRSSIATASNRLGFRLPCGTAAPSAS